MTDRPIPTPPNAEEASTSYEPSAIEAKWQSYWESADFFHADETSNKEPFVVMMPPPNVTGRLHMGHALQDAVQDALTRMKRMQGYNALWMPGLDHAGIATQNRVEQTLKEETGQTRHDLGRAAFIDKVWEWKDEYGGAILEQKRRLGVSADSERGRFTMDEGFTRAVQETFVKLYQDGLIYRGNYLVNWDPDGQTAISDEEVDNVERDGSLWFVRYELEDGSGSITVATTRPETIMGDTAVAVHPDDERYADWVGKMVRVPLTDRVVPVIADDYVKSDFGAGALKITPAHDKNDFDIGKRHDLAFISVIGPDAKLTDAAGAYAGQDRFDARKAIVADLDAAGLLDKIEPYKATVPISSRSKAVIEPLQSTQWFVRMKPLADPALEVVRDGQVVFHPKRWENEYYRWLENVRDWTISRQLWWGHRIPAWYYVGADGERDETRDPVVSIDQPEPGMVQDDDVLDTWFSSWLWPFATLGWPDTTRDLAAFYPGHVLVSGYDILYFWIARMVMAGLHFMDAPPFRDVFITGMIKDAQGRWMSKSLGNGIDPIDMIEQYGADAVRYSLTVLCTPGQDIRLEPTKFEMGRNFANKIWNAFNVFGQFMDAGKSYRRTREFSDLTLVERWMVTRLNQTIASVEASMERYRLSEAVLALYDLFWRDYCDWYLELIKPQSGEEMSDETIALAVELYEQMMQLLHPFMPFITEELWHRLRPRDAGDACIASSWPAHTRAHDDQQALAVFELVQELVSGIRSVKASYGVAPSKEVSAVVSLASSQADLIAPLNEHSAYFARLARAEIKVAVDAPRPSASATVVAGRAQVFVPLAGMIDLDAERERLTREIEQKQQFLQSVERKLGNEKFTARAPEDVVEKERQKARDAQAEIDRLVASRSELEAA